MKKTFNFINTKKYAFIFSGLIIAIGIVFFIRNGGFKYGNDFAGGIQLQINLGQKVASTEDIKKKIGLDNIEVTSVADFLLTKRDFVIEIPLNKKVLDVVPNQIKIDHFENGILKKIKDKKEKKEIVTFYLKNNNRRLYLLKSGINKKEKLKVSTILKSVQFNQFLFLKEKIIRPLEDHFYEINIKNGTTPTTRNEPQKAMIFRVSVSQKATDSEKIININADDIKQHIDIKNVVIKLIGKPVQVSGSAFLIKANMSSMIGPQEIDHLINKKITASLKDKYKKLTLKKISISKDLQKIVYLADIGEKADISQIKMMISSDTFNITSQGDTSFLIETSLDDINQEIDSEDIKHIAKTKIIKPLQKSFKNVFSENETSYAPTQGAILKKQALKVSGLILLLILVYIGLRFHFKFGIAAIIALIHDTIIVLAFVIFFNREVDIPIVVALLTIMGYSLNDTIVVFDRIRENQELLATDDYIFVVNKSIHQSLSRTVVTSLTTLFVVSCLFVFGGAALESLSFALIVGVIVGTYSSIFIASPALVIWENLVATDKKVKKTTPKKKKKVTDGAVI